MDEVVLPWPKRQRCPAQATVSPHDAMTRLMWRRTLMANERTYSAWVCTVLSLMAVALALPKLVNVGPQGWIVKVIGVIFLLVAGALFIFASLTYSETDKRLREEGLVTAMSVDLPFFSGRVLAGNQAMSGRMQRLIYF